MSEEKVAKNKGWKFVAALVTVLMVVSIGVNIFAFTKLQSTQERLDAKTEEFNSHMEMMMNMGTSTDTGHNHMGEHCEDCPEDENCICEHDENGNMVMNPDCEHCPGE